jgi:hypothetical protein
VSAPDKHGGVRQAGTDGGVERCSDVAFRAAIFVARCALGGLMLFRSILKNITS